MDERASAIQQHLVPASIPAIHPDDHDCRICHEPFLGTSPTANNHFQELPVQTSCSHTFGASCITAWLTENDSCPTCRTVILPLSSELTEADEEALIQFPEPWARSTRLPRDLNLAQWQAARNRVLHRLMHLNNHDPEGRLVRFVERHYPAEVLPTENGRPETDRVWMFIAYLPWVFANEPLASWSRVTGGVDEDFGLGDMERLIDQTQEARRVLRETGLVDPDEEARRRNWTMGIDPSQELLDVDQLRRRDELTMMNQHLHLLTYREDGRVVWHGF